MEISFTDKVVLVTGASAGIGEATAILFASLGAQLALVGRDEAKLGAVAARCEAARGRPALAVVADLGTDAGCETAAKETLDRYGRLDVLVNNAGVGARTNIQRTDMATFDRVFNVNVRGVYNLTRLLTPALLASKGNIVNISSVSGVMPSEGSLPYSMSKAALDHFTRCIALELAPQGVRVNSVNPGLTETTFQKRLTHYTEEQYQAWLAQFAPGIPLQRVCQPEDIARMVVHLASPLSALVTGAVVPVDGGLLLRGAGDNQVMKKQMDEVK